MAIEDQVPLSLPPILFDMFGCLVFIFASLACILAAGNSEMREIRLTLPEVSKNIASKRAGGTGIEVVIKKSGVIEVNGREIGEPRLIEQLVSAGQQVEIIIEKGAAADKLITVEGHLKKSGVKEVALLVKEGI